jgi:hypothetical protein
MVVVHGLKRDIARPKAVLATHKPARLEAIEGSLPVVTHQQPFARETGREDDTAPEARQAGGKKAKCQSCFKFIIKHKLRVVRRKTDFKNSKKFFHVACIRGLRKAYDIPAAPNMDGFQLLSVPDQGCAQSELPVTTKAVLQPSGVDPMASIDGFLESLGAAELAKLDGRSAGAHAEARVGAGAGAGAGIGAATGAQASGRSSSRRRRRRRRRRRLRLRAQ